MCSNNARCVKERGASGVPNEEFDWMIFEKKSSMGDRISSVKAIGSGSWRWGVAPERVKNCAY